MGQSADNGNVVSHPITVAACRDNPAMSTQHPDGSDVAYGNRHGEYNEDPVPSLQERDRTVRQHDVGQDAQDAHGSFLSFERRW